MLRPAISVTFMKGSCWIVNILGPFQLTPITATPQEDTPVHRASEDTVDVGGMVLAAPLNRMLVEMLPRGRLRGAWVNPSVNGTTRMGTKISEERARE